MVGLTRLQNGHWKSENSTMFTCASAGPLAAPSSGTRTRSTPSPMPMAFLLSAAERLCDSTGLFAASASLPVCQTPKP